MTSVSAAKRQLWRWAGRLASLKLTLVILVLLAMGILVAYHSELRTTWALAVPLFLFAVNLTAAVITNPAFRRQTALLVFHLALIAIVLLVAAGRLTYLKGYTGLAEGETFDGVLTAYESGPWHWWRLDKVSFANEGFNIDYDPGPRRNKTTNRVRWTDEEGREQVGLIGDHHPLVLKGYRFYTSFNKGFAPIFLWLPKRGGEPQRGSVHLPGYPNFQYRQAQDWQPPGAQSKVWIMLQFDEVILEPEKPSRFRPPQDHKLVLRVGEDRRELKPGDHYELPEGILKYEGLTTWMGYTVYSDLTISWLLAACIVAVLSLSWHFWVKFFGRPRALSSEVRSDGA